MVAIRLGWFCECVHEGSGKDRTVTRENGGKVRTQTKTCNSSDSVALFDCGPCDGRANNGEF